MSIKFGFLTNKQVFKTLEAPNENWRLCKPTDFAKTLGAYIGGPEGNCVWHLQNASTMGADSVYVDGSEDMQWPFRRDIAARPATLFEDILREYPKGVFGETADGIKTYTTSLLSYPQTAVNPNSNLFSRLNALQRGGNLKATGMAYTVDSVPTKHIAKNWEQPFTARELTEYNLEGKNYISLEAIRYGSARNPDPNAANYHLTCGEEFITGTKCWIEVLPTTFLVLNDTEINKEVAFTQDGLYSGVQLNNNTTYFGNFEASNGGLYLKNCFAKNIERQKALPVESPQPGLGFWMQSLDAAGYDCTPLHSFNNNCFSLLNEKPEIYVIQKNDRKSIVMTMTDELNHYKRNLLHFHGLDELAIDTEIMDITGRVPDKSLNENNAHIMVGKTVFRFDESGNCRKQEPENPETLLQ